MDDSQSAPVGTHNRFAPENLPLLRNKSGARLYQAYCVTEASRPPTPDALTPKSIRIRAPLAEQREREQRHSPTNVIARALAIKFEQGSITTFQEQEDKANGKEIPPNEGPRSGNTMLAIGDHITQAVTPRGSHPLTTSESTVCDRTPSHLRMQQTTPTYVATSPKYRRKPLRQHANIATMEHRPLPPLPFEPIPNFAVHDLVPEPVLGQSPIPPRSVDDQNKGLCTSFHPGDGELRAPSCPSRHLDRCQFDSLRPDNASEAEVSYTDLKSLHAGGAIRERRPAAQQNEALADSTQLSLAEELHALRVFLTDTEDARCAHRRTQPKDAKFRYQFGRRPSVRLENPPPPPLHRSAPIRTSDSRPNDIGDRSVRDDYFAAPSASSMLAKVDTQTGPRPPPWGSTDNLEMRRQTRSDAREREDARKYRLTTDSGSSMYRGSDSTVSLRENTMRREVEEYREQVLRIYPDMEFDGRAGEGGRRQCCCVVM